MQERIITVDGSYNVRDMGGYEAAGNRQTRTSALIRAGNLDKVTPAARQQLIDNGLKTVIDIRDEWEAEHYPNVFAGSSQVIYQNIPLIGDALSNDATWQSGSKQRTHLHESYIRYIERCQSQIAAIITVIAEAETAVIFHCHAGKDRTGIIAALLLRLFGVSIEDIAADYSLSHLQIPHLIAEWRAYALEHGRDMAKLDRDAASDPETIIAMLAHIESRYDDVTAYLKQYGVTDKTIAQLHGTFLT